MARPHPHKRAVRVAAISILSFMGAVLAVWAAPRVSEAVEAWMSTPPVRSTTTTLSTTLTVAASLMDATDGKAAASAGAKAATSAGAVRAASPVIDAGMRFTMVGVTCRPPKRQGAVDVLVRTSEDGATWSRWYRVALERAAENGAAVRAFTEPIWTGGGRYVQVAAQPLADPSLAPVRLAGVAVVAINSTEDADRSAAVVGVLRRTAATVAGIDLTPAAGAMTTKPTIVTRKQWGANESWRSGSPSFAPVKVAFIHHTASGNSYSAAEGPAVVRGVYHYHTRSLHWSDVGYNFLVDRYGQIYEGRYGGVTKGVIGAQVLGFNTGSTGVSVIGTFESSTPPSAAVTSLERLLEWKLDVHHVDPLGTGKLTCGYGQRFGTGERVTFKVISGHRDANYTGCPGKRLYALLPSVRKVVARTGQPKIYGFVVDEPAVSPNADGVNDRVTIGFTVSEAATWRLEIRDEAGQLVRQEAGEGTVVSTTWTGQDDEGKVLPDGEYSLEAAATSSSGEARPATATVMIDTAPPRVNGAEVTPDPFSPNGDGQSDSATFAFEPAENGSARLSVVKADGTVLRRVTGWKSVGASMQRLEWDGRVDSGSGSTTAPEGSSILELELRDVAGNTASVRRKVTVDKTLKLSSLSRTTFSPNGDGKYDSTSLGFRLTRKAEVTATVIRGGQVVRTLDPGAGAATWNGSLTGGAKAASGAYGLRVEASGELGTTSISAQVMVDLLAPKISAPATAVVRRGKAARVVFVVRDKFSPTVKVGVTVTDARARKVKAVNCGWVKQGVGKAFVWRPKARGKYTLTFRALDQGGNAQAAVVRTSLKVR